MICRGECEIEAVIYTVIAQIVERQITARQVCLAVHFPESGRLGLELGDRGAGCLEVLLPFGLVL